jgi:hypothetical protein
MNIIFVISDVDNLLIIWVSAEIEKKIFFFVSLRDHGKKKIFENFFLTCAKNKLAFFGQNQMLIVMKHCIFY